MNEREALKVMFRSEWRVSSSEAGSVGQAVAQRGQCGQTCPAASRPASGTLGCCRTDAG